MNKKIILKVLSFVFMIMLVLSLSACSDSYDGKIEVEIVSLDGYVTYEKSIKYNDGDKLVDLVSDNFDNVVIEDGMIMAIEDYETPEDWSTFLSIYINDEMSMVGITEIEISNGMKVSFIITEFSMDF